MSNIVCVILSKNNTFEEEKKKVSWYQFSSNDYWELVYKEGK